MAKHAKNSVHLQIIDLPKTATVEIPLPILGAFSKTRSSSCASTPAVRS